MFKNVARVNASEMVSNWVPGKIFSFLKYEVFCRAVLCIEQIFDFRIDKL